ncbi:hypothetical protein [Flavobacterium sp.]|uniref:hypothetical protein n=1 Tax=Flavobacterium sp. TaxID=239 RepID=UPI002614ECF9|nr:hypothetical protein [Flavobacterium sp.]
MRKFLVSLLWFFLPVFISLIVLCFGLKKMVNSSVDFTLDSKINTLVLGHSQTEHAFKDSIIFGLKNLCFGGESYFYTYQKLKIVLEKNKENKNIKNIIVSFSNNQIESVMNKWTYGEKTVLNFYPKYSFAINAEDSKLIAVNNFKAFLKAEHLGMISNAKLLVKKKSIFEDRNFGGYNYINKSQIDSLLQTNYIKDFVANQTNEISSINLNYLDKIVALCKAYEKNLIFIRTPIHQKFFEKLDEIKFQEIRNMRYSTIPFLDYHGFSLENKHFKDFNHLNDTGAKKFSNYFNKLLSSGLLIEKQLSKQTKKLPK